MNITVEKIRPENFRRFGKVIGYPDKRQQPQGRNLFRIVVRERQPFGWRIAYLVVRDKSINRLEQHRDTFESFEPVKGKSLLYVSDAREKEAIRCFLLDRPVVLKKGVWHGIVTAARDSEIKISENANVRSLYWRLGNGLVLTSSPGTSKAARRQTR